MDDKEQRGLTERDIWLNKIRCAEEKQKEAENRLRNVEYLHKQEIKALDGIEEIKDGVTLEFCEEIIRLQEKVNAYIWCSKDQIIDYLDFL